MPDLHVSVPAGRGGINPMRRRQWLLAAMLLSLAGLVVINSPARERIWPQPEIDNLPPVNALHPVVAAKMNALIQQTKKAGITILITDGFRSNLEQDVLYEQGRSNEKQVVTNVRGGESFHNYGLAIDFALRTSKGNVIWDLKYDGNRNGKSDWMEVVAIAKSMGFAWGGDWKSFKDYPHLQMDFGYSIRELKRGKRPPDTIKTP
ncbi:M15 family metallopeptidase [Paenibacillus sp. R14(2021)]|uniref:M15 family metallopeptidase n=1 Tax=Paenibacillus sp. R14(2021) TaxID=2859228 RepID=UPI0021585D88|nr:M15 family metallopeptidase [Paenibacillus sp. R14(2021)]